MVAEPALRRAACWLRTRFTGAAIVSRTRVRSHRIAQFGDSALALVLDGLLPLVRVLAAIARLVVDTGGSRYGPSSSGALSAALQSGLSSVGPTRAGTREPRQERTVFVTPLAMETGAVTGLIAGTLAVRASSGCQSRDPHREHSDVRQRPVTDTNANGLVVRDGRATIIRRNADSDTVQTAADAIHEQVTDSIAWMETPGKSMASRSPSRSNRPTTIDWRLSIS
ncbi:hypothetical protein C8039_12370 [Halogeometricum sp. wsp3]|nr:hypothetical protein C8039_12370 [Halogeometricum sp. wsp3]